jgi:hypothetical protein
MLVVVAAVRMKHLEVLEVLEVEALVVEALLVRLLMALLEQLILAVVAVVRATPEPLEVMVALAS